MKRVQYSRYGGPEVMQLAEVSLSAPGPHEVLVRVVAAAINPVDWKVRRGDMRLMTGHQFPKGMGLEFSGIVEATGDEVRRLARGDEVFGTVALKASGAIAEMVVTQDTLLARKPSRLSFEEAACLSVAPVAAWRGLVDKANVAAGQRVFIAGCCGAVGRAAVQIARQHGVAVAGSCGPRDMSAARALGVDPVLDYTRDDISALQGQFDIVFDTAGQLSVAEGLALLSSRAGKLLDINFTPARMFRGLFSSRYKVVMGTPSLDILQSMAAAAMGGTIQVHVGRTAPLSEAIELIREVEQGRKGSGRAVVLADPAASAARP